MYYLYRTNLVPVVLSLQGYLNYTDPILFFANITTFCITEFSVNIIVTNNYFIQ